MEITITSKEVAERIAAEVGQTTGTDCEAFSSDAGSVVIVSDGATIIARITPLFHFGVMDVTPVGGLFDGETVNIPLEAETIGGLREIANAMDRAASHVLNAAMHH